MKARELWLESQWPNVLVALPPPPAVVVEIGCGSHGGFVPALRDDGYEALGIDPAAPEGDTYQRTEFERADLPPEVHAFVACTSLHHVADPADVVDRMAGALSPGGVVVIIEWDWQSFDESTANWCFARLGDRIEEGDGGWLHHQHEHWVASQQPWPDYLRGWAEREHIHSATTLMAELDRRFERISDSRGAYFFPDLFDTTESEELRAIGQGRINATRIDYVGRLSG